MMNRKDNEREAQTKIRKDTDTEDRRNDGEIEDIKKDGLTVDGQKEKNKGKKDGNDGKQRIKREESKRKEE